jgi:hypothetical protein
MAEQLRIRSYRMCCDAVKLTMGQRVPIKQFDQQRRRLQRNYADVRAASDAASHVDRVDDLLRKARLELRGKRA